MKKYLLNIISVIALFAAGMRIFNHIHAWFGAIICLCAIYPIYKLIKLLLKDETKN